MFPIAWAAVPSETKATWKWFIEYLREDLNIGRGKDWTFVLDRQKGLMPALYETLLDVKHRRCARHIYAIWRRSHGGLELQRQFWKCCKSASKKEFELNLEMLKKTFFYNFIPSKVEEEACMAGTGTWQVQRTLLELRDVFPPPMVDPANPWQIRKVLTHYEAIAGKLVVPFADAFDHVFRYWGLCMVNQVVMGQKSNVVLWDVTDQNSPKRYGGWFEVLPGDDYILACMDLFKERGMAVEDEVGLYWDFKSSAFHFKLLHKIVK
ncbi:unnamed protein product [Cuscuta epithymum]|uniref:MULE transposase domain-containing protein n=1 Tax=Cuscuta epithymum TaxID=186058 RepID=A0AAV0F2D0_9ASTE|nr:unnamed protein product [Cuscuta epithymum]